MSHRLDLVALYAFVGVAEVSGFRAAADTLGMTPSGVSKAIARLEKRIGTQLIVRTTRSLRLTAAGAEFHRRCKDILDELAKAERDVADTKIDPQEEISISTPAAFGRLRVVPLIAAYCERFPGVRIAIQVDDEDVGQEKEVDLAVRIGELNHPGLLAVRVSAAPFVCCGSGQYLASKGRPTHPADLDRHRSIGLLNSRTSNRLEWRFVVDGVVRSNTPRSRITVDDSDALVAAAEAGAGLIMVHSYLAERSIQTGSLIPLLHEYMPPPAPIWIVRAPTRRQSASARNLGDFLKLRLHAQ
jgi:DNA-binding transcriptional LysR family regulator